MKKFVSEHKSFIGHRVFDSNFFAQICGVLSRIADGFEDNPIIHNKTIVYGPRGSGKSTICDLFFKSICSAIGISHQASSKWICKVIAYSILRIL